MGEKLIKAGSQSLFMLIRFLNIVFGLSAIALIGLGIWLWRQFNSFTILQILFIGVGVFQFLLVLLVWTAKRSTARLRCYLFFMILLFVLEVSVIIIAFATGDKVIDQIAKDSKEQIQKLKQYLNIVIYYCIGSLVIMFFMMIFTYCYIGSIRNKNFDFDYKVLDEYGNQLTMEEKKELDKQKINEKYDQKRRQLQQKYPNFRSVRENNNS